MKRIILNLMMFSLANLTFGGTIEESKIFYSGGQYVGKYFALGKIKIGEEVTIISVGSGATCKAKAVHYPSEDYPHELATELEFIDDCPYSVPPNISEGAPLHVPLLVKEGAYIEELQDLSWKALRPLKDLSKKKRILEELKESSLESKGHQQTEKWNLHQIIQAFEVYRVAKIDDLFLIGIPVPTHFRPAPQYLLVGEEYYRLGKPWSRLGGIYRINGRLVLEIDSCKSKKECEAIYYYINN